MPTSRDLLLAICRSIYKCLCHRAPTIFKRALLRANCKECLIAEFTLSSNFINVYTPVIVYTFKRTDLRIPIAAAADNHYVCHAWHFIVLAPHYAYVSVSFS